VDKNENYITRVQLFVFGTITEGPLNCLTPGENEKNTHISGRVPGLVLFL